MRLFCRAMVFCAALGSAPLHAHGLKVFAYAEGARVEGSVHFAGGGPAGGARVRVFTPDGRVLAELESAADGTFGYQPSEAVDQVIRARTAEGHAAEWALQAEELHAAVAASGKHPMTAPFLAEEGSSGAAQPSSAGDLEALIEGAVARQVRPLREQLVAYEERVRLRDLIGGIGYILGLAGLVLWWRSRRSSGG